MSAEGGYHDVELRLRYRHGRGAYARYFDALAEGRALASRDPASGAVHFPPRAPDEPASLVELSGQGLIVALTRGPSMLPKRQRVEECCFVLVAMDSADNATFGRVIEGKIPVRVGDRVRLAAPEHPWDGPTYRPLA